VLRLDFEVPNTSGAADPCWRQAVLSFLPSSSKVAQAWHALDSRNLAGGIPNSKAFGRGEERQCNRPTGERVPISQGMIMHARNWWQCVAMTWRVGECG